MVSIKIWVCQFNLSYERVATTAIHVHIFIDMLQLPTNDIYFVIAVDDVSEIPNVVPTFFYADYQYKWPRQDHKMTLNLIRPFLIYLYSSPYFCDRIIS
jgi:hypothetical protein